MERILIDSILNNSAVTVYLGHSSDGTFDTHNIKYDAPISNVTKSIAVDINRYTANDILNTYPSEKSYYLSGDDIYICLSNNGGSPSTEAPHSKSKLNIKTDDGYVWRYLCSIYARSELKYLRLPRSTGTVPIKNPIASLVAQPSTLNFTNTLRHVVYSQYGRNATFVYDEGTDGKVKNITVALGGSDYRNRDVFLISDNMETTHTLPTFITTLDEGGSVNATLLNGGSGLSECKIHVIGDGTGASVTATLVGSSVGSINVTPGSGYTWFKLVPAPSINSFATHVITEPKNGIGFNIIDDVKPLKLLFTVFLDTVADGDILNFAAIGNKRKNDSENPEVYSVAWFDDVVLDAQSQNQLKIIISGE